MNISTIVIPAAGFGTRFLPFTKSVPKELLPLLNKPAIQEIIEEGVRAGVFDFSIVISNEKRAIQDYLSPAPHRKQSLSRLGKGDLLAELDALINQCTFSFPLQREMRGLGHAILMAKENVKGGQFGVMLPDDLIFSKQPCMAQLAEVAKREAAAAVIGVMEVPPEEISAYGSIKIGTAIQRDIVEIVDIIEKPAPGKAFSNRAIVGRYVLPTAIFDAIETVSPTASGEIQLTDAITYLIKQGHSVLAYTIKGTRFDLGRPAGWLAANMYVAEQLREKS